MYLGMFLDESLSFNEHVDYLHNKVSSRLGMMYFSRKFLNQHTALTLYKSLVLPYFDFGGTVYSVASVANSDHLQKLQNLACRTILLLNRDAHVRDMHISYIINQEHGAYLLYVFHDWPRARSCTHYSATVVIFADYL